MALGSAHVALFISVLSCLGSWCYTYVYVELSRENRIRDQKTREANLFSDLYTEYSTPSMLDAIDEVEEFRELYSREQYAYEFFAQKKNHTDVGKRLDHARRLMVRWHTKVQLFYDREQIHFEDWGDVLP